LGGRAVRCPGFGTPKGWGKTQVEKMTKYRIGFEVEKVVDETTNFDNLVKQLEIFGWKIIKITKLERVKDNEK